jgi:hypothetical protein
MLKKSIYFLFLMATGFSVFCQTNNFNNSLNKQLNDDSESTTLKDGIFTYFFDATQSKYIDSIRPALNQKANFYKRAPMQIQKEYNVKLCNNLSEFNLNKPSDLADYDAGYYQDDTIYMMIPETKNQKKQFTNIKEVATHTFAKVAMYDNYNGNIARWMEYGFARVESGLYPDTSDLKNQYTIAGRMPTVSEMMSGNLPTGQDFYDFATTMMQFIVYKFGHGSFIDYFLNISGQQVNFNYWSVKDDEDFETVWLDFTKLFYFNDDVIKLQKPSENFDVWMTDKDLVYYDILVPNAEFAYKSYRDSLKIDFYQRMELVIYPTKCEYQKSAAPFPCDPNSWSIGGGIDIAIFQMVSPADIDRTMENMITLMKHELAHVAQFNIKSNFMPAWLSEGFATFMPVGRLGQEDIVYMRPQLLNHLEDVKTNLGHYPTMTELEDYGFVGQNNIDYYLIGQAMVDWLVKKWGFEKLSELIISDGQNVGVYGFSTKEDFMDAFYNWVQDFWKKELYVSYPKKDVKIYEEQDYKIRWEAEGLTEVFISYSTDAGKNWTVINSNVTAADKIYTWSVPEIVSDSCIIMLKSIENEFVFDYSDTFKIMKSIGIENNLSNNPVNIFPNPLTDKLKIKTKNNNTEIFSINIYDIAGKLVSSKYHINNSGYEIDFSDFDKGVYFVEILMGDRNYIYKVVKN